MQGMVDLGDRAGDVRAELVQDGEHALHATGALPPGVAEVDVGTVAIKRVAEDQLNDPRAHTGSPPVVQVPGEVGLGEQPHGRRRVATGRPAVVPRVDRIGRLERP
ncbi:hypothetical protein GCM10023321_81150 [Pseudonocardia eucalypti]|uniref:Uncharacterized protein n=1 Tax=Pseudonocardia eucalypti TaxID=648755 RepID=A0ABP9RCV4_9PSEU